MLLKNIDYRIRQKLTARDLSSTSGNLMFERSSRSNLLNVLETMEGWVLKKLLKLNAWTNWLNL